MSLLHFSKGRRAFKVRYLQSDFPFGPSITQLIVPENNWSVILNIIFRTTSARIPFFLYLKLGPLGLRWYYGTLERRKGQDGHNNQFLPPFVKGNGLLCDKNRTSGG